MKNRILLFVGTMLLALGSGNVSAAEVKDYDAVQVEIVSPEKIEATPIYEGDVEIVVTNTSDTAQKNLNCFLTVVDEDRKQSFPMDEFGPDSYQTRTIDVLEPGESATVTIPLRVMYVGNFQLIANVTDYETGQVYAADSLPMTMTSDTNLHKGLVMGVSVVMPIGLISGTAVLSKKRGKRKE